MALINKIDNVASVTYDEDIIDSNTASTNLLLQPTLLKSVDKSIASIGEILTYSVLITNVAIGALTNLPFADEIPEGTEYVEDSFKLNDSIVSPTITDNTLNYTILNIGSLGSATISFQVEIIGGESE